MALECVVMEKRRVAQFCRTPQNGLKAVGQLGLLWSEVVEQYSVV